jgi:peptidoglycan glycosyltransferase
LLKPSCNPVWIVGDGKREIEIEKRMFQNRRQRQSYAGRIIPRHLPFPRMLRRTSKKEGGVALPRLVVQALAMLVVLAAILGSVVAFGSYSAYEQVASSLKPRLAELQKRHVFETSRIYDRHGRLLYEFFGAGKRTRVSLDKISPLLIEATIAIEDKTFFINPGVDYEGIARALYQNVTAGDEVSGASTITQQVIKYIVLSDEELAYERRYERKFKEIILAQELNRRYTKEQILEIYLNEVFYGNLAYGIEAASNVYFGVNAKDLTLAQASLLAGLPQLPSKYDPVNFFQRDDRGYFLPGVQLEDGWLSPTYQLPDSVSPPRWRQVTVLRQMVDEGYVSEAEARQAVARDLRFVSQDVPLHAPHFVFYVRKMLEEKYGQRLVSEGGLNIYTTLDLDLQRMVQAEAARHIESLKSRNIHNAAVVVMQPNTGQILAMVGSVDYNAIEETTTPGEEGNVLDGQVNVTIRERQPGSALKPFTYLAAMEQGMTPASVLWDVPTQFPTGSGWYKPKNYNGRWNGPVRIRTALANSLNMPAIKALKYAGIDYTLELLDRVGIKEGLKRGADYYGLSLTLGGGEVTLLELTTAYNTLASNGQYFPPTSILKITDGSGHVLESYQVPAGQQVIEPALNSIIVNVMSDDEARAPIWGRNSKLKLSQPAAVKTGTSEDWRDAWTLGFSPYVTVGVWSGNNNNEQTHKVESLQGGGVIWHNVMERIFQLVDATTAGKEGSKYDPTLHQVLLEPYPDGTLPQAFPSPDDVGAQRKSICALPGPFGGYGREWFTPKMLYGTSSVTGTRRAGRIEGACDSFRSVIVVRIPGSSEENASQYCRPVEGQSYSPEQTVTMNLWNLPKPEPGIRVSYGKWASRQTYNSLPLCTPSMFATPEPEPSERTRRPPVDGAILMPDVRYLGENQAKEALRKLGVQDIVVDRQGRDRIPNLFDRYAPYTVVSTQPAAGNWIYPGMGVVLGVRGPDDAQSASQSQQPSPAPSPTPQGGTEGIPADTPAPGAPDAPGPDDPSSGQPPPTPPGVPDAPGPDDPSSGQPAPTPIPTGLDVPSVEH